MGCRRKRVGLGLQFPPAPLDGFDLPFSKAGEEGIHLLAPLSRTAKAGTGSHFGAHPVPDLRDMFGEVGLRCWAKTCGGQGLHLCVPLNTPATFSQVRAFARMVAETYVNRYPDMATTSARKQVYPGQVFIDWQANQEEQPSLCVYSLCSNGRQTTVSTPVTWREIKAVWMRQEESPLVFGPDQVIERVASKGDLFEQVLAVQQRLPV